MARRVVFLVVAAVVAVAGCGSGSARSGAPTSTPLSAASLPAPPATAPWSVDATVGDLALRLEVAMDKAKGLADRDSLDGIDGMLFDYGTNVDAAANPYWMKGMRFPLDIRFFAADGSPVGGGTMAPCTVDPCPKIAADAPFRWVVEVAPGRLSALPSGARLVVHD